MALAEDHIVQDFFQTASLENVTEKDLVNLASDYPFYAGAHFLLAKKLYNTNAVNVEPALQKAALHFTNNCWLNFLLNEETISPETTEYVTGEINEPENQPARYE